MNIPWRRGRRSAGHDLLGAALFAWALPGCPLSDHYRVDAAAGRGGAAATGGSGASAATAGVGPAFAGNDATGGAGPTGGTGGGGTAGDATAGSGVGGVGGSVTATGGSDTGGSGGSVDTGGAPDAGGGGMPPDCVPATEVCDGIDNDCNGAVDDRGVCPTSCTARTRDGHVYVLCMSADDTQYVTYAEASTRCAGLGAELGASFGFDLGFVESAEENTFLKDWIMTTAPADGVVWMGANDIATEGTWVWGQAADAVQFFEGTGGRSGSGGPVDGRYNDFGQGRPNSATAAGEDCGAFDQAAAWDWNDVACTDTALGYLCEETP